MGSKKSDPYKGGVRKKDSPSEASDRGYKAARRAGKEPSFEQKEAHRKQQRGGKR